MQQWRQYTMFAALLIIWGIFAWLTQGVFLSPRNLSNLFVQTAGVGILAIGMSLIIITRNIDLSVGSGIALTGAVAAWLQVSGHQGLAVSVGGALAAGLLIGVWQGYWIAYQGVPAFIVTLAGMMIFRGLVLGITEGATIAPLLPEFKIIGQGYISPMITIGIGVLVAVVVLVNFFMRRAKQEKYGFNVKPLGLDLSIHIALLAVVLAFFAVMNMHRGLPFAVFILFLLAVIFHFIATNTIFGRHLFALGGNPDAAALSGINIKKRLMILYAIFGVLTGLAGVVMTARLNAATTSAGTGMELDVIAACVIGGTSLMGGQGSIAGVVIGALIMASLDNGMSLMDTNITYQYIIKGMILLLAVWMDIQSRKSR
jgi:D-xylose transport system permease protein